MYRYLDKWSQYLASHPFTGIIIVAVIVGIFGIGATNFSIDASAESLLLDDDPDLRTLRELTDEYGSSDFLAVTISPDGGGLQAKTIERMRELQDELSVLEKVSSVNSIDNAIVYPDERLSLADAFDALKFVNQLSAEEVLGVIDQLRVNPFFQDQLISSDGKVLALFVTLKAGETSAALIQERYEIQDREQAGTSEPSDSKRNSQINFEIQQINERNVETSAKNLYEIRSIISKYSDIGEIRLVGPSMIIVDMVESLQRDISVFGIAVFIIFVLMLLILLRRILWMLIPIACAGAVVVIVAGSLGFMDWKVTVLSSNFVALLMILTISLVVHIMVRHSEEIAKNTNDNLANDQTSVNATVAIREVFLPCLIAAVTTALGFGSLLISGIKPVEDFGKMMILGISLAFIFSFTLAPAMLGLFAYVKRNAGSVVKVGFTRLSDVLFNLVDTRYKTVVIVGLLLLAILGFGTTKLQVDNKFLDYFKQDSDIYKGMYTFDKELGGIMSLEIILNLSDAELAQQPEESTIVETGSSQWSDDAQEDDWEDETESGDDWDEEWGGDDEHAQAPSLWLTSYGMNKLRDTTAALSQVAGVGKIVSIDTAVALGEGILQRELNDFELSFLFGSLPEEIYDILIDPYFSKDQQKVRMSLRLKETESQINRDDMLMEISSVLDDLGWQQNQYQMSGLAVLYNNLLQSLFTSQILTLGLVLGSIWILLVLMFRSLSLSSIAMVPTLLSSGSVLGVLGWTGKPLDILTVTVASVSVGLAVDNAVHYLNRFRKEMANGKTAIDAVKIAHNTVAQGIVVTNLSIMSGFLVFTLSDFIPTIFFGLLVCLAMGVGSFATLTVLPSLLVLFSKKTND